MIKMNMKNVQDEEIEFEYKNLLLRLVQKKRKNVFLVKRCKK